MALPEWGIKRVCAQCQCRFYDLQRSPIACPRCEAPFDPETFFKTRKARSASTEKETLLQVVSTNYEDSLTLPDVEDLDDLPPDGDLIEDVPSLEEDNPLEEVIEDVSREDEE